MEQKSCNIFFFKSRFYYYMDTLFACWILLDDDLGTWSTLTAAKQRASTKNYRANSSPAALALAQLQSASCLVCVPCSPAQFEVGQRLGHRIDPLPSLKRRTLTFNTNQTHETHATLPNLIELLKKKKKRTTKRVSNYSKVKHLMCFVR